MSRKDIAKEAIQKAGGSERLARELLPKRAKEQQVQQMTWRVLKWAQNGIPAEYVLRVEAITGISRHRLHPKIYPHEAVEQQETAQ